MFAFLEGNLKYVQIGILLIGAIYLIFNRDALRTYYIPIAILLAGASSNILDRVIHRGGVDYVYWHCGFEFAIFNFADVIIDIAVVLILWMTYKSSKQSSVMSDH